MNGKSGGKKNCLGLKCKTSACSIQAVCTGANSDSKRLSQLLLTWAYFRNHFRNKRLKEKREGGGFQREGCLCAISGCKALTGARRWSGSHPALSGGRFGRATPPSADVMHPGRLCLSRSLRRACVRPSQARTAKLLRNEEGGDANDAGKFEGSQLLLACGISSALPPCPCTPSFPSL